MPPHPRSILGLLQADWTALFGTPKPLVLSLPEIPSHSSRSPESSSPHSAGIICSLIWFANSSKAGSLCPQGPARAWLIVKSDKCGLAVVTNESPAPACTPSCHLLILPAHPPTLDLFQDCALLFLDQGLRL